jgi:hypothetical protein
MFTIFWLSYAVLWTVVLVQGFALLEIVRQLTDLRQRDEVPRGPRLLPNTVSVGATLPTPSALHWAETGERVEWSSALGEVASAVVLLHPGCATCYGVASELRRVADGQGPGINIIPVVSAYSEDGAQEFIANTSLPTRLCLIEISGDSGETFARALNVNRKPAAVVLKGSLIAAAATVLNGEHVETLLKDVLSRREDGRLVV